MKWSPEVTWKIFYWGTCYYLYTANALGRKMDTAVKAKLWDSIERCFSFLPCCCFELKCTTEISSVKLVWFWSSPWWVVAYIARAVIAWDTIVFYRQLGKKQAIEQDKILKFPLWPASSFLEVRVWWAVLRNLCTSSRNKYEAIYIKH